MATRIISTKLAVEGEAAYRQAIAACNSELKTLKSDLSLVESEFRNNANSMEALTAKGNALYAVYNAQQEKISELIKALRNCEDAAATYAEKQADLKSKLDASSQAVGALDDTSKKAGEQWVKYADELSKSETALEQLKKKSGDTSSEQAKLEDTISRVRAKMAQLEASTGGAAQQAGELLQQDKKLNAEYADNEARLAAAARGVQDWQAKLNSAKIELNSLDDKIRENDQYLREAAESADGCATSIDKFGSATGGAGTAVEQLAAALAAAGVAKTVKEIADELLSCASAAAGFETAMAKLSTLIDTSVYSMDSIKADLVELSNETGVAVGALAEAAYQARSAGVDAADVISFVSTATKTSVAGFTDSATAVDVLTTALNAYKLEGSEAERVASMLVKTQDEGKTSVGELAQNMGRIIPVAAAYNVSLGNLTTSYALLTKSGTNTRIATTNLSAMLTELAKDGSAVADVLTEQTGKSFAELTESGQTLGGVMEILADSVDNDATAFSNLWSSTTAGQAALSLLNSGAEEFNRTLDVMENSSGAVDANFQIMADTTELAQQRMVNAANNLRIAIGDQLNPALENLYETGADAFTWATDFAEENPQFVQAAAGAVTALGLLSVGIAGYMALTAAAKAAQDALNLSIGLCPVVAITAGVGALVGIMGGYIASASNAGASTAQFTKSLQESKAAYDDLISSMEKEQASVKATADSLKNLLAVEKKSATDKAVIKKKVDELIEAVPGLALAYDELTDSVINADTGIKLTAEDIDAMLARAAGMDEYNAKVDRLSDLYNEQADISNRLKEAREQLAEAEAKEGEEVVRTASAYAAASGAQTDYSIVAAGLRNTINDLTSAEADNAAQIAELEVATEAYSQGQDKAASRTDVMAARVEGLMAQMSELQDAYEASYQKAKESIDSQLGLFNKLDGEAKTTISDLISTLQGQVQYMDNYAANIQKAMEMGVDEGLIAKLSDGKEESAQILDAIVKGGSDDIAALNAEFAKVEDGKDAFASAMAELETDFSHTMELLNQDLETLDTYDETYAIGQRDIQGLIDGAASKQGELVATYQQMAGATQAAYKAAVDQHSPSKKFAAVGSNDVLGLIEGANAKKAELAATYTDLAMTAFASYKEAAAQGMAELNEIAATFKDLDSYFDIKAEVGDLEYELWERTKGKYATDAEKYAKQQELLNAKLEDQAAEVDAATAAWEAVVAQYGEGTAESYEYQRALLEETLALQDLLDSLEAVTAAKQELARQNALAQLQADWNSSGVGLASTIANSRGYITPYEAAEIGKTKLILPDGSEYASAVENLAHVQLSSAPPQLPSTMNGSSLSGTLERQLESFSAVMINAISDAAQSGSSAPMTLNLVLGDGTTLASYLFDPMTQYADANGTPILNPM